MKIQIELDLTKSQQKYVHVNYQISGVNREFLVLNFPTWSPGSYLIREYASQVESFLVEDLKGRKLKAAKISKCQWRIETKNVASFVLSYRVYGNDLHVRGLYADERLIFINTTAVIFHIDDQSQLAPVIKIKTPKTWRLACVKKSQDQIFYFKNFDELYDTPILCAARLDMRQFKIKNTRYQMALWGRHAGELEKIIKDVQKIVERQGRVFKDNPCHDYLFQVLFVPRGFGGLEHASCSTNIFDGQLLGNAKDYRRFLALLSHEHFHLWNVKRIRPVELGPFDYIRENYTRDLWMAEGITSYYDEHALLRSRIHSRQDYLSHLADNLTKLEANKAVRVNSISESSFDAWIRYYRQNENSINTVVSYYLKGGLVMMLLDFKMILASGGKHCLDDVMYRLYQIYKKRPQTGITRAEFFEVVTALSGLPMRRFVSDYIDGIKAINWRHEFAPFGISVTKSRKKKTRFLGVILSEKEGKVFIQAVAEDSPAYFSSLQAGDELIAINGERFESAKTLDAYLVGDGIDVMASRLGQVFETRVKLNRQGGFTYDLALKKKMSPVQKRNLNRFLRS